MYLNFPRRPSDTSETMTALQAHDSALVWLPRTTASDRDVEGAVWDDPL